MASVGDESYDSLPSAQRIALALEKQRLLQQPEPKPDAQETKAHQHPPSATDQSNGVAAGVQSSELPESLNVHRTTPKSSSTNKRPRLSSSNSAPAADMEKMVRSTQSSPRGSKGIAKAASFTNGTGHFSHGGDTQPVDSQVYRRYTEMESMREEPGHTTPQKQQSPGGTSPETMGTDHEQTPQQTLQPGQAGYVDLGEMWQDRPLSPATSFANYEELLAGDGAKSPDTQFFQPQRPTMPETPALAGQKHGREGEPLTSVTTATRYSQILPQGNLMGATQLFAQTQENSSPYANGPPSEDAMTRPSPNANEARTAEMSSPPRTEMSSPVVPRTGEPRAKYIRMKESQELREQRRRAQFPEEAASSERDSDSEDTQQRKFRAKQLRHLKSEQALKETASVRAPRRGQHLSSSTRKPVVDLVTPATTRRRVSFDDILEEAEEDDAEAELPEGNEGEEHAEESQADDDDQYDELQEKVIRSQSNFRNDDEDSASFVGSVQANGVEVPNNEEPLEDTQDPEDAETGVEDDDPRETANEVHDTQRSTIADSQPLVQAAVVPHTPTPQANHSSMASFVPGSQYAGKTSQEQAFLRASHPSQNRVAASQANEADKVPSSPPLPEASVNAPTDFIDAASGRQDGSKPYQTRRESTREDSATPQEVPESDVGERAVQGPQPESRTNGLGEEESINPIPFSTAQTHVSASTRSPTKSYVAPSPLKAFRSQQNETPRKAFRDMIDGPRAMNGSFDFVDVDDIMAGVMTKEDEEVLAVLSSPKSKRRRKNGSSPASTRLQTGRAHSDQSARAHAEVQQNTMSESNITIQDSEPDFAQPALPMEAQVVQRAENQPEKESMASKEMEGGIPESETDLAPSQSRGTILRDSPSKANVLPAFVPQEQHKARSSTPDSAEQREDAGSRHVSQLITTTRSSVPVPKKGKLKTPGRAARRKSDRASKASNRTSRASRRIDTTDEDEDEELDPEEVAEEAGLVDEINRTDTTPPLADRVHEAVIEPALPTLEDLPDAADEQQDVAGAVKAPARVWARFRGTPPNFYPATWIGSAPDGMSYKIRFDDKTVTNIETWHVRNLDFRIGDQVKVDNVGTRNKNWKVVGFGAVVGEADESEVGTDMHGHAQIKVQATSSRNSVSEAPDEDADETREVLVSDLYLTLSMWKHYKDREFSPPKSARAAVSRAGTPSSRLQTPDGDTPSSRSRRAGPLVNKTKKKFGSSHLRDSSVTSAASAGAAAIFSGMAFAITYISDDAEKAQVTRMILRNGGVILEEGFGELFDVPNLVEPVTSPTKKSPRKDAEDEPRELGLHLKSKFADYGFVALIADRHSRRAKYMQALALDLPTLSGRWVLDSLNEGKNPSLGSREMAPLPWGKYLLPAGESSYLGGAIRSRVMLPYDVTSTQLRVTVQTRPLLLNDEGVLIVAPKKDKVAWERRRTYAFLTLALGAGKVERVNDLQDAKNMIQSDPDVWKWVYVDGKIEEAFSKLCGKSAGGKKRKRGDGSGSDEGPKMSITDGNVTVVNDEFVVQSLILGALVE